MMRKLFLLFLLSLLLHQLSMAQQVTTEEIQKQLDQALKDPKIKAMYDQARKSGKQPSKGSNTDSLKKLMSKGGQTRMTAEPLKDSSIFSPPPRNEKVLQSLPIRVFNRNELVSYLSNLNTKITEILHTNFGTDINDIPVNATTKTGTSIGFWIDGQQDKSVLIALKGAETNPDNVTLLNNLGGILTGCGLGVNAIPILQYVLEKQPGNNMVLNNLGQAYYSLGEEKKAEQYLLQCVSSYKDYPDANLALACIYKKRGDKSSSLKYVENSLRGGWSEGADNLLHILKPDAKLMDYLRHRYKQPEYFNFNKYPMLPQCTDTKNTPVLKPQYAAYKQMLAGVQKKYALLQRQEEEISRKTVPEKIANALKARRSPYRPFGIFAAVVLSDLATNEYGDKLLKFTLAKKDYQAYKNKLTTDYLAEVNVINEKHKLKKEDVAERDGEGNGGREYDELVAAICAEKEVVRNRFLGLFADTTEAFQQRAIHLYKDYFNDMAFWSFVASVDDHQYKAYFYSLVSQFLLLLSEINTSHFYNPCQPLDEEKGKADEIEGIDEPDCVLPGKLELPLGAVRLELSCESFKLEAGEGLVGKLEYNRGSGDFTLAFGVGASVPRVLFEKPGIEVGLVGEAKSQFYIVFDKQCNPTDLGVLWETELKLEANMSEVKYSYGMEEGLTAGFGSGVQMRDGGPLKRFIDDLFPVQPNAKQINKNVPLYKK